MIDDGAKRTQEMIKEGRQQTQKILARMDERTARINEIVAKMDIRRQVSGVREEGKEYK